MTNVDKKGELKELAEKIRIARKHARLSQAALGQYIGVSDKSISSYEKGRSVPPIEKLKKIAQITNHPVQYFTDENVDDSTIVSKLQTIEKELEEIKELLQKSQN